MDHAGDVVQAVTIRAVGKKSEADHSPGTAHAVNGHCAHRIINLQLSFDKEYAYATQHTGNKSCFYCSDRTHECAGGRDGNETSQESVGNQGKIGLAVHEPYVAHGRNSGRDACKHCVHHYDPDPKTTVSQGRTRIEPKPAEEKNQAPYDSHRNMMTGNSSRISVGPVFPHAGAEHDRAREPGNSTDHVNNR